MLGVAGAWRGAGREAPVRREGGMRLVCLRLWVFAPIRSREENEKKRRRSTNY